MGHLLQNFDGQFKYCLTIHRHKWRTVHHTVTGATRYTQDIALTTIGMKG